jgi:hypothetical protein
MDVYSTWAAYGFLIIIAVFFSGFIYFSSYEAEHEVQVNPEEPVIKTAVSGTFTVELAAPLNKIYFSVISLIVLYIIIFVLLIF